MFTWATLYHKDHPPRLILMDVPARWLLTERWVSWWFELVMNFPLGHLLYRPFNALLCWCDLERRAVARHTVDLDREGHARLTSAFWSDQEYEPFWCDEDP